MEHANGFTAGRSGWDVFLSYSSQDATVAGRIQRFLEQYKLPDGRRLTVYRDETDILGGDLPEQLRKALGASGCLVVCCSEAAAQSDWVNLEIESFEERAPGRPIIPVIVSGTAPSNLPEPLRDHELRRIDVRAGWRLALPRRKTRVELVRLVAAVAEVDFRALLPLDRQRRRRTALTSSGVVIALIIGLLWLPVLDWADVTPEGVPVFGCETLDDGIAFYRLNVPQAIKNIVHVQRDVFGPVSRGETLGPDLVPRGRLLPEIIGSRIADRCGGSGSGWVGAPAPGMCVRVSESEEIGPFYDPMGGGEAPLTDITVNGETVVLDRFWTRIDPQRWQEYGRTVHPSSGLPVAASGTDLWLGFPGDEFTRGHLWHTVDGGQSWEVEPGITDVRSVRHVRLGVMVAARKDGELGFFLRQDGVFEPFEVPGKGDQLEVCGEVGGQPVIRTDRTVYHRVRRPWWRTQFAN